MPSVPSLIACLFYVLTAALCLTNWRITKGRESGLWLAIGCFFIFLAFWRFFMVEDLLRALAREALMVEGLNGARRSIQWPIAAVLLIAGTGAGLVMATYRKRKPYSLALKVAALAVVAMGLLILLRLVSLHSVDAFLYGGAKLNWIIDLGSTFSVALAARYHALAQAKVKTGRITRR